MVYTAIAGFFIVVIVGGVGFGVASAASPDDAARAGAFGFSDVTRAATVVVTAGAAETPGDTVYYERSAMTSTAPRDISANMKMVDEIERLARERAAAEDAAALERVAAEMAMQGVEASAETAGDGSVEQADDAAAAIEAAGYDLPAVDWSVGKDAFVAEWMARIDGYLAGSPLEGYGWVFAEAAWENGVDPRWSPAISNTESGKGSVCFRPYNAWGWGNASWYDWETAIRDHVAGLASGYGYSITAEAARSYCPPTWTEWYSKTLEQMSLI